MLELKTKIEFALAFFIINVKFEQSSEKKILFKRAYITKKDSNGARKKKRK